jgi:predicted MFS family arabinose efflux permease
MIDDYCSLTLRSSQSWSFRPSVRPCRLSFSELWMLLLKRCIIFNAYADFGLIVTLSSLMQMQLDKFGYAISTLAMGYVLVALFIVSICVCVLC